MTKEQARIRYLKAVNQAWDTCRAAVKQAGVVRNAGLKQVDEAYRVAQEKAMATCEAAEKQASEAYDAALAQTPKRG